MGGLGMTIADAIDATRTTTPIDIAHHRAPPAPYHSILSAVARWNVAAAADEARYARKATQDAERDEKRGQNWRASEARKKAAEHAANAIRHRLNASECETVLVEAKLAGVLADVREAA